MEEKTNTVTGVPAGKVVMPIVVLTGVLHLLVIIMILMINSVSTELSTIMQNAGKYNQDATSLLAGSSLLSETSSNFILMPKTEGGEVNLNPLAAYAAELTQDRRGPQVVARFKTYDVPEKALEQLEIAAESADNMLDAQLHAIALIRTIYTVPPIPALAAIPGYELTEEELAMPEEARENAARGLILGSAYGLNKQSVSQSVNACVETLQQESARKAAQTGQQIAILRVVLWVATLSIIVIVTTTFILLFTQVIRPLEVFAKRIPAGQDLDENHGAREVRTVAAAYNGVRRRRDALDTILRSAAETDALTNLPNRYRFEQFVLEAKESGYSVAVLLFDVNYLKQTNDTRGHLAGDQLLCTAADCIASSFGENCFRFGGDEFAAIIINCTPEMIENMLRRFEKAEAEKNISISYGYAYTDDIGKTSFKRLLDEADHKMYMHKDQMHAHQ